MSQEQNDYWNQMAYKKHDLSNCESEPLQFCGAIQSCGLFLGCDLVSGDVIAISANASEKLGLNPEQVLGKQLNEVFLFGDGTEFDLRLAEQISKSGPVLIKVKGTDSVYTASIFHNKTLTCIDIEELQERQASLNRAVHDPVQDLKHLVHLIDSSDDLQEFTKRAVDQIRTITAFDRVMIYQFQPNWDGRVIAESLREGLEPFLDLHYPASDIPAQARHLYLNSKFRMIVDSEALAVPIVTRKGLGRSEIDLSCSAFRASSPIHIQYLKNMGVRTSFSLPIKLNNTLWGLISCHGYGDPIYPSRQIRAACELAAQVISGRIGDSINQRRLQIKNHVFELTQGLLSQVTVGDTAVSAFARRKDLLLNLTDSSGAYVRVAGEEIFLGDCPSRDEIGKILTKLSSEQSLALWETQSLTQSMSIKYDAKAVGAMAVPLSLGFEDLIIWFRPEHIHEIKWGGKPTDGVLNSVGHQKGLSPRDSFAAWSEQVKERSKTWSDTDRETAQYLLFTFVQGIFKKAAELSKANSELARATKAKDEFIGMVSHELRTPLGVMMGWIEVLKDYQFRDPDVTKALGTIDRNAKLQINLINDLLDVSRITSGKMRINPEPNIDVNLILADTVAGLLPTANAKSISLIFQSQDTNKIVADPDRLRQIIWNLITNAIKFTPKGGSVTVKTISKSSSVSIAVTDTGVGIPPERQGSIFNRFEQIGEDGRRTGGLGLGLSIVKSLIDLHGGRVNVDSHGDNKGSTFTVTLPVYALKEQVLEPVHIGLSPQTESSLQGIRILLSEDHEESAAALKHILTRHGASVSVVHDGYSAFEKLKNENFDLLLSDIGMPIWDGYRVISELRKLEGERQSKALPAVALTAYATGDDKVACIKAGFQSHHPKPIDKDELLKIIVSLVEPIKTNTNAN